MKCDRCTNEATVHDVTIKGGKRQEKHLCEQCAHELGMGVSTTPLTDLLTQFVSLQSAAKEAKGQAMAATAEMCPSCGMTFADFRKNEKLGCMHCYQVFERQIGGLLERLHEGATHHVGKTPRRLLEATERGVSAAAAAGMEAGGPEKAPARSGPKVVVLTQAQLVKRAATLRKKLDEAVALEQYEKAAQFRDELVKLQKLCVPGGKSAEGGGASPGAGGVTPATGEGQ